jgi:hypothetical protein
MKAKFLKPSFSEKSEKIKLWFEVEGNSDVFALKKGETYEIELCDTKLPNMAPSPKDLLKQALSLISQASEGIPDGKVMGIDISSDDNVDSDATGQGKCITCDLTEEREDAPIGCVWCIHRSLYMPVYRTCVAWTNELSQIKEDTE